MSFQQGLSGLNAAARNLDVIGNNVANASTIGFKSGQAQFSDVFANSAGGADVGNGAQISSVRQQFVQGNISVTNNPLDVAISGQGFFRLSDSGSISYSRNGQFQTDNDGYIINAEGKRLTGYGANGAGVLDTSTPTDLRIARSDLAAAATASASVSVNLDSRSATKTAGSFVITDPTSFNNSTSLAIYDSLGNAHTLSTYFQKIGPNTFDVYTALDGVQVGVTPTGTLSFDTSGALPTTAPFAISVPLTNGATTPLVLNLDFNESTQFGSAFGVNALSQDGYTTGRLSTFGIEANGDLFGRYSNGQSTLLGQVVLANFANPQGLVPLGASGWAESAASGAPAVGTPGTGSLGALQEAAVEESTVDITAELVAMITAQRLYQANAQSIKTQDSVLQTIVNLR